MASQGIDAEPKVPRGRYRVIGIDTFPWPNEEYSIGVYDDLNAAKGAGQKHCQDMTVVCIYDDSGRLVAQASGRGED